MGQITKPGGTKVKGKSLNKKNKMNTVTLVVSDMSHSRHRLCSTHTPANKPEAKYQATTCNTTDVPETKLKHTSDFS